MFVGSMQRTREEEEEGEEEEEEEENSESSYVVRLNMHISLHAVPPSNCYLEPK